jgi:uncharacterized membrane protein
MEFIYVLTSLTAGITAFAVIFAMVHITANMTIVKIRGFPKNIRTLVAAIAMATTIFVRWYNDVELTPPPPHYKEVTIV